MPLSTQNILRSGAAGLIAGIIMFIPMVFLVKIAEVAPFNIPPSAALLKSLGLPYQPPVAPALHFIYGIVAAIVFVALFKNSLTIMKALAFSGVMWLVLMLVFAPIIGWGVFGTADTGNLPPELQLGATLKFIVVTLALHILYALVMGYSAKKLVREE
mgnify:CR=1 FL=1